MGEAATRFPTSWILKTTWQAEPFMQAFEGALDWCDPLHAVMSRGDTDFVFFSTHHYATVKPDRGSSDFYVRRMLPYRTSHRDVHRAFFEAGFSTLDLGDVR